MPRERYSPARPMLARLMLMFMRDVADAAHACPQQCSAVNIERYAVQKRRAP